jgi:predicted nucleic acid-binding protein
MRILLDTNILLRLAQPVSPHHAAAVDAMLQLDQAGVVRCLVPQVLYEFWLSPHAR